jgi:hypothetical protein
VQAALLRDAGIPFVAQPKPMAAAENFPGRTPEPVTGDGLHGGSRPAVLRAALRWHWQIAGLVIAAAVALIAIPGPRSGPAS